MATKEQKISTNSKISEFQRILQHFFDPSIYIVFMFGNTRRLDINGKFIYLWQSVKGDIHYSFSLLEKDYHTTSIIKIGNVLSKHFGCDIQVVNNTKERLKKMISATNGLNQAMSNSEAYNYFNSSYQNYVPSFPNNMNTPQIHLQENHIKLQSQEK